MASIKFINVVSLQHTINRCIIYLTPNPYPANVENMVSS